MLLTNYITSAWRNILRHKLFSIINILGLAIGLAAVMLIALYVRYETSYDSFWKNADNIYRVQTSFNNPGQMPVPVVTVPGPLIHALKKDFPQITYATRITQYLEPTIGVGGRIFDDHVRLVDPELTSVFDLKTIAGDIEATLSDNRSVALSRTRAIKYFGDEEPIGRIITVMFDKERLDYKVTAVYEDIPKKSMLNLTAFALLDENERSDERWLTGWFRPITQTFFTMTEGSSLRDLNDRMVDFMNRSYTSSFSRIAGSKPSDELSLFSIALSDIHLKAVGFGEQKPRGSMTTVIIFSAVAILILVIACINFMNLSTARASDRAKEVSLRKILGASRNRIILQFVGEAMLISLFALLLALSMVEMFLPYYNEYLLFDLTIDYVSYDILYISGLTLFVGLIAGSYPAFILSNFKPSEILGTSYVNEPSTSSSLRSILVVFQFSMSIALIVSTAVVYGQMFYALNMELGYDKENMMVIQNANRDEVEANIHPLMNELRKLPEVISAARSFEIPGLEVVSNSPIRKQTASPDAATIIRVRTTGFDYFKTYKVPLIAGRTFSKSQNDGEKSIRKAIENETITSPILINHTGLKHLGLGTPEEALNTQLFVTIGQKEVSAEIVGVLPDVYFESLKFAINPEITVLSADAAMSISLRFNGDPVQVAQKVKNIWQAHNKSVPFAYDFVSDLLRSQYKSEQDEMTMFTSFSILAVFIASLGLFGLANFTTERRTKEIGIRKVFGASVTDIIRLLVWQFTKPVMLANIIAWPAAFFLMDRWLESFVYRIDNIVILTLCAVAGLAVLLIAWATVAGNSYAVARQSPIKALRYE